MRALLLALILAGCTPSEPPVDQTFTTPQDREQCGEDPTLPWCEQ